MLNTYIQNRGITQTIIHNNKRSKVNEIKWNANYDGETANISVSSDTDGNKKHYEIELDDQDLAAILNVQSVNMPIHQRLQKDFVDYAFKYEPNVYQIELPIRELRNNIPPISSSPGVPKAPPNSYLSSPLPNEELILPLMIGEKNRKKYTHTPNRRRLHRNSHKTYRAYKKRKSSSKFTPLIKHRSTRKKYIL